jgi:hypothetical protein
MNILIFKTNIQDDGAKEKVARLFTPVKAIQEWSVDTEDVDCVLRVVTPTLSAEQVADIINAGGFSCQELE